MPAHRGKRQAAVTGRGGPACCLLDFVRWSGAHFSQEPLHVLDVVKRLHTTRHRKMRWVTHTVWQRGYEASKQMGDGPRRIGVTLTYGYLLDGNLRSVDFIDARSDDSVRALRDGCVRHKFPETFRQVLSADSCARMAAGTHR